MKNTSCFTGGEFEYVLQFVGTGVSLGAPGVTRRCQV